MKTVRGFFKDWEAVYCHGNDCTLVVGISKGPRLLSFSYLDGPNLLYEDHTDFGVGDWKIFGGHRFTVAPESDLSYIPDNAPCEVFFDQNSLTVQPPVTPAGIRKSVKITPSDVDSGFSIEHQLRNEGAGDWEGAIWAITCVPAAGSVHSKVDTGNVEIWAGTKAGSWQVDGDRIVAHPDGSRGKIGWYSQHVEIVSVTDDYEFSIRVPETVPMLQCVDGGCNLELFFCKDFYELETLGGSVVLAPGGSVSHVQQWRVAKR